MALGKRRVVTRAHSFVSSLAGKSNGVFVRKSQRKKIKNATKIAQDIFKVPRRTKRSFTIGKQGVDFRQRFYQDLDFVETEKRRKKG